MVQTQGEMKECEVFNVSLSIRGFCELKPCIHASYSGDNRVFIMENFQHTVRKFKQNLEKEGGPIRNVGNTDPTIVICF